jgi:hypothetical protein
LQFDSLHLPIMRRYAQEFNDANGIDGSSTANFGVGGVSLERLPDQEHRPGRCFQNQGNAV